MTGGGGREGSNSGGGSRPDGGFRRGQWRWSAPIPFCILQCFAAVMVPAVVVVAVAPVSPLTLFNTELQLESTSLCLETH